MKLSQRRNLVKELNAFGLLGFLAAQEIVKAQDAPSIQELSHFLNGEWYASMIGRHQFEVIGALICHEA